MRQTQGLTYTSLVANAWEYFASFCTLPGVMTCNENEFAYRPWPSPEVHHNGLTYHLQILCICTLFSLWSYGYKLFGWNGLLLCAEVSYLEFISVLGVKQGKFLYEYQAKNSYSTHLPEKKNSSRAATGIFLYILGERERHHQRIREWINVPEATQIPTHTHVSQL